MYNIAGLLLAAACMAARAARGDLCFDVHSLQGPHRFQPVFCPPQSVSAPSSAIPERRTGNAFRLRHPIKDQRAFRNVTVTPGGDVPPHGFNIYFQCLDPDALRCLRAKQTFQLAGQMISSALQLRYPITVNATFLSFCAHLGQCPQAGHVILGLAAPQRSVLMQDDDGIQRIYPQALVKQFQLREPPEFGSFDIMAQFNSDVNFHFPGDQKMKSSQSDFLFVVIHEMIHGLGFSSSWDDYWHKSPQGLTPNPVAPFATVHDGPFVFYGFFENVFDRYIVSLNNSARLSDLTSKLNQFDRGPLAVYDNSAAFLNTLENSASYKTIATVMLQYATTKRSLAFQPNGNNSDPIVLETGVAPYNSASSISHVDFELYGKTSDFLMRYLQDPGASLPELIQKTGNYSGGPIGPRLIQILHTLGYPTVENPEILYIPNVLRDPFHVSSATSSIPSPVNIALCILVLLPFHLYI